MKIQATRIDMMHTLGLPMGDARRFGGCLNHELAAVLLNARKNGSSRAVRNTRKYTVSVPAASLSTAFRLPARRDRLWVSNYLIYIVFSSILASICRAEPSFLPELREEARQRGRDVVSPHSARPARFCGRPRGRVRLGLGGDLDLDGHAERIGRKPGPGAGDRHRLTRVAGDRDADQAVVADDAVGRIELDPAGTRQVNLEPGVGRIAADTRAASALGDMEVAADKPGGEGERAHRLH